MLNVVRKVSGGVREVSDGTRKMSGGARKVTDGVRKAEVQEPWHCVNGIVGN